MQSLQHNLCNLSVISARRKCQGETLLMFILGQRLLIWLSASIWILERPSLRTTCEILLFVFTGIKAVLSDNSTLFSALDIIVFSVLNSKSLRQRSRES